MKILILLFISRISELMCDEQQCHGRDSVHCGDTENLYMVGSGIQAMATNTKYLLYDVNPGEGFNLRRDVYMRVANLVHFLNEDEPWTLVLPPWGKLYHWKSSMEQSKIQWSTFFDISSLRRYIPVIEFEDYIKITGKAVIDEVFYMQRYEEGWEDGKWTERLDVKPCMGPTGYIQEPDTGMWMGPFWGYPETRSRDFKCLSTQAQVTTVKPFILEHTKGKSVLMLRAENIIHGEHSEWSQRFWIARRSLVFASHLRHIGDEFRESYLDSNDVGDNTIWEEDWTQMKRRHGEAVGGPYLAVHLRRRDFLYGHAQDVPSLKHAAFQIDEQMRKLGLEKIFVATDAPTEEYEEIKNFLKDYQVYRFVASRQILEAYTDGGVAIIDQWICAHARHFMGTSVSTFSFRIHEEREILGFDPATTFNRLCGDNESECEPPSKWKIVY